MRVQKTENTGNLFLDTFDSNHVRLRVGGSERVLVLHNSKTDWFLHLVEKAQNGETLTSNFGNQFAEVRENGTLFFWVGGRCDSEFWVCFSDLEWVKNKLNKRSSK
tara:strand:- start:468 stop:785 length:318 start_codon:yes stop_codon:yes gene_type:complete